MKAIKVINSLFTAALLILVFSTAVSYLTGLPLVIPFVILTSLYIIVNFLSAKGYGVGMKGMLTAGIYREVWTGEVIKRMETNDDAPWAARIKDYSQHVKTIDEEMQAINIAKMGVLPNVLFNNTTYPIAAVNYTVSNIPIALDKLQTEVSTITDDQLYASSVKQMGLIPEEHALAVNIAKFTKGIHSLSPSGNTADMPVLLTTGADDGTGRKMLTWDDISDFKRKIDNLKNPVAGNARILVLCTDHENDLIVDQKFKDQYYNRADGKPYNQLSFDFYCYHGNPFYAPATKLKKSFNSVPAGTDRKATVYFNTNRAAKAFGWTKVYMAAAKDLPRTQQNEFNVRHNAIILPTQEEARGAIVSDNV
jgi:hypothetical protein